MANPRLQVFNSAGRVVAENDDWSSNGFELFRMGWAAMVGTFPFPTSSRDAEVYVTLLPGAYTLVISGSTGTDAGVVIGEIYSTFFTYDVSTTENGVSITSHALRERRPLANLSAH